MKERKPYNVLRWAARISGTLIVVFTLTMVIGETIESQKRGIGLDQASFTPLMMIIFVIWGIALAGLVLALWKERLGGIISLASYALVYILNLFNKEASMNASAISIFFIFSIPSILYLIWWKLNKDISDQKAHFETPRDNA